jgi:tRNA dimethylallyltransferase
LLLEASCIVEKNKLLIVIAGPTAVGKTAVAIDIASRLRTEIVSADSRQIYREMNIGTAKPSAAELSTVRHHFIDSHSIGEDYDAASYGRDALALITRLFAEKDFLLLCGGSGLYIKAVCDGFDEIPDVAETIRAELVKNYEALGLSWLQQTMQEVDPGHYQDIDQQNPHRLIRALEVKLGTGKSIASFRGRKNLTHDFKILKIGLELPREQLYQRIERRVDQMIAAGLFDEATALHPFREKNALQTVGYQEVFNYIDGVYDLDEAVRQLKQNTRRYAKRQMTWFKKDGDIKWFHPDDIERIMNEITAAFNSDHS